MPTPTSNGKKYKLFAAADGEGKAPCAFFLSDRGCRSGDNCNFAHMAASSSAKKDHGGAAAKAIVESGSMVSSESEEDDDRHRPTTSASAEDKKVIETGESKKRKNRRSLNTDSSPFANPKKVKTTTTPPNNNNNNNNTPAPTPEKSHTPQPKKKKEAAPKEVPKAKPAPAAMDFRALNLPVATFALDSADENAREPAKKKVAKTEEPEEEVGLPLPKHTKVGRKWLAAVETTRAHTKFATDFNFEKYVAIDEPLGGKSIWCKAKPFGDWCKANPQSIAIDCEMCQTKDPVSGASDSRALCRISIVDAETDEVLLDSLVKPDWPVVDYRSRINGITGEHLENVQFSLAHAQKFLLALCSAETVIIGHSVNNDLAAMRMEHYCVVDSACLFKASDSDTATVGLKDLSMNILKKTMPSTHDSVNDARVALRCLEHYLEKDGKVETIVRTPKHTSANQLFVHRIPKGVNAEHLSDMFLQHTDVLAESVDELAFSGELGKTHIHFKTMKHANLAFATIEGKHEPDATGRLQKKIYLRAGGYVRVRKMVKEKEHHKPEGSPEAITSP
jgi:RNA exonuclease 1